MGLGVQAFESAVRLGLITGTVIFVGFNLLTIGPLFRLIMFMDGLIKRAHNQEPSDLKKLSLNHRLMMMFGCYWW